MEETLKELGYPALLSIIEEAQDDVANAKAWFSRVQRELSDRLEGSVKNELAALDKATGTVNIPLQGGMIAKGIIDKKVEWDNDKLMAIAWAMPWERVTKIFKITFSVPERVYDGIRAADEALAAKLDTARTIKVGDPKITLSREAA
ncbi:hypothetical protein UFOVP4_56 [uncultured Caudovirales phage]|uniref:Uncharacterized protein n=1 Tax=uncultured Caudovirales phage TaxID=2100421 RepID=A0A6J5TAJ6_9CAUD|nr:hypothetical protein UFOVP4_56 [uncultured Caudovirales phage]CAB4241229.1 hypothetical protein UFOVP64_4 [uncultured Caudovirales phage]CAB5078977.1 hypothetical protein UFOVP145_18 [uncultured Caudovirales phage]